jgi:hypothetical protein
MIGKRIPANITKFMDREIVDWTFKDGSRQYELPDGRVVKVWNGSFVCLRCGRPLKSKISQQKGYGACCKEKISPFPLVKLLIYIYQEPIA